MHKMKKRTLSLGLLGLTCLAGSAASQTPTPLYPYANAVQDGFEVNPWPASPFAGGGAFMAVELLDLDMDGTRDAVVLDGGYVVFMPRPEDFSAYYLVQKPASGEDPAGDLVVNDFSLLDQATGYGGYGAIVTVGEDGLGVYIWDSFLKDFFQSEHVGGVWEDCVQVELADIDADGDLDIMGLDPTGASIHVRLNDGAGSWTSASSITLPSSMDRFVTLNWQGNARPEIAGISSSGLIVVNTAGVQQAAYSTTGTLNMLGRLDTPSAYDQLAWVEGPFGSGPAYTASVYSSAGLLSSRAIPTGEVPAALGTGTWGTDGYDDLAIAYEGSFEVSIVDYDGSNLGTVSATSMIPTPYTDYGGNNQAPVVFADMDFDGKPDAVMASTPARALLILHHEAQPVGAVTPTEGAPIVDNGFQQANTSICLNSSDTGYFSSLVIFDENDYVSLEVTTWIQDAANLPTEHVSLSTCTADLTGAGPTSLTITADIPAAAMVPDDGQTPPNSNPIVIHVMVTPLDASGIIMERSIIGTFCYDRSSMGSNQSYIELADGWSSDEEVLIDDCGSPVNGSVAGGHQGSKKLPPMPAGKIPRKATSCVTPSNS